MERLNRTLKSWIFKLFTYRREKKWIDEIQNIVHFYNNKTHRTLKISPSEVNEQNESQIYRDVFRKKQKIVKETQFELNDYVRIALRKPIFEKGYTRSYTCEIFKIFKINRIYPVRYFLKNIRGEELARSYYTEELVKVRHKNRYLVSKILASDGSMIKVRYLGLPSDREEWIRKTEVL